MKDEQNILILEVFILFLTFMMLLLQLFFNRDNKIYFTNLLKNKQDIDEEKPIPNLESVKTI